MDVENIGALIYTPNNHEIMQYKSDSMELFQEIEDYWMKKEGLIFFPFDPSKQAFFFGKEPTPNPVSEYDLTPNDALSKLEYETSVFMAKQAISAGEIQKVVLARNELISKDFSPLTAFQNAVKKYPSSYGYYVDIGPEQWVGASPELLVHYEDEILHTVALAGTRSLEEEFTAKEYQEQQLVCDFIEEVFASVELNDFQKSSTTEEAFSMIKHLKTSYAVACSADEALQLLKKLQPTPAVCGLPRDSSFEFIQGLETMNRSFYSGVTGILSKSSATFFVNLRCMRFYNDTIELFAGAGITADSEPTAEWEETKKKIHTIKDLLS